MSSAAKGRCRRSSSTDSTSESVRITVPSRSTQSGKRGELIMSACLHQPIVCCSAPSNAQKNTHLQQLPYGQQQLVSTGIGACSIGTKAARVLPALISDGASLNPMRDSRLTPCVEGVETREEHAFRPVSMRLVRSRLRTIAWRGAQRQSTQPHHGRPAARSSRPRFSTGAATLPHAATPSINTAAAVTVANCPEWAIFLSTCSHLHKLPLPQ